MSARIVALSSHGISIAVDRRDPYTITGKDTFTLYTTSGCTGVSVSDMKEIQNKLKEVMEPYNTYFR
jgi:hypothetical protein